MSQPAPAQMHVDGFMGGEPPDRKRKSKRKGKMKLPKAIAKAREALQDLEKAALSTDQRNDLDASDFVFPDTREYPIPDAAHARNALARGAQHEVGERLATIRRKVAAKFPDIDVSKADDVEVVVPLFKDDAKQIVYGVVLTPGLTDSQGDVVSADEIEKAAHRYLVEYRKHDVQHAEVTLGVNGNPFAETVESFIAPQDMQIADQPVLKGSWVIGVHVTDPDTWGRVQKGEITGFSIGGTGERVPLAA